MRIAINILGTEVWSLQVGDPIVKLQLAGANGQVMSSVGNEKCSFQIDPESAGWLEPDDDEYDEDPEMKSPNKFGFSQ